MLTECGSSRCARPQYACERKSALVFLFFSLFWELVAGSWVRLGSWPLLDDSGLNIS